MKSTQQAPSSGYETHPPAPDPFLPTFISTSSPFAPSADLPPPPKPEFPLLTPISGCSFWGAMLKLWPRPPHHISPAPSGDGAVRGGKLRGCSSPLGRGWVLSRGQSGRGAVGGRKGKEPSRRCVEHDIGALKGVSSPAGGGSLGNFSRLWRGREGCPAP